MSKRRNVHPDHYKTAGSLRPGEDVVHEEERERLSRDHARVEKATGSDPQGSSKAGKTSSAKKEAGARHGSKPAPAAAPTAGAFGKSPGEERSEGVQERNDEETEIQE